MTNGGNDQAPGDGDVSRAPPFETTPVDYRARVADPIDELRAAVARVPPAPPAFAPYLEKVRAGAYAVTDGDVDRLRNAGQTEDEIFEQTVAAAVGEGLRRLDAALRALA